MCTFGSLSCQQVVFSRFVSRISPRDETRRNGENALCEKVCFTSQETYKNTVLKNTHHNLVSTFNQSRNKKCVYFLILQEKR